MRYFILITLFSFIIISSIGQASKTAVYLIPGQGSDYRLFSNINLDSNYDIKYVHHCIPDVGMTMAEYAKKLLLQIDTSEPFILIGVSLGGMLSVEISEISNPLKVIIISSAKSRNELPRRYRFQKEIPIYDLVSGNLSKKGALFLQPIVEPDRDNQKDIFVSMLTNKDPVFLKRTIAMIIEWERTESPENIIHIHGDNDKTIPIRNVKFDYLVKDGSHMMVLTRGDEISKLLLEILN